MWLAATTETLDQFHYVPDAYWVPKPGDIRPDQQSVQLCMIKGSSERLTSHSQQISIATLLVEPPNSVKLTLI